MQAALESAQGYSTLLTKRKAGLAEFTDEVVNRSDVKAMIEKIDYGVHPVAEAAGYEKMTTIIDI